MSTADLQTTTENAVSSKSDSNKVWERESSITMQVKGHSLSRDDLEFALYDIEETMEGLKISSKTIICNSKFAIFIFKIKTVLSQT